MNPNGPGGPQVAIGAEVISHTLSSKKPLVYPLFGDAAGATVIELVPPDEGAPTQMGFAFGGNGQYDENLYIPAGGSKKRASHETVDNDEHSLYMDGDIIKQQAIENMALLTKQVLAEQHMDINDVDLFIPHQANLQIMLATAEAIGFPRERVMETIRTYGNTSSASIPTALSEAWDQERIHRNDMLLVATFGAGLTFGAGIIPMVGLPKRK